MNKNSKRQFEAAHDAFARIRKGSSNPTDELLARTVGHRAPLGKHPKVGRSAADIMRKLGSRD